MINNFLSCAWIYILESFHHHRRPWFENLLKISMNLKDSTNFQIYFFTPIPPLKSSFLSIWTKKKKKKRKSLPARYLNLDSRNERDSTLKAREESLTSFRRYFIKYMADDVERERERERQILHLSSSFINRRRKKECSRKRKLFEERRRRILEM